MLKEVVSELCDDRGWSMRRLACNMSIKKHRLESALTNGASVEMVHRIAEALDVPVFKLMKRRRGVWRHVGGRCGYSVNDDGSLRWES